MPWPKRSSSTARGYGYAHQQARKAWAPTVEAGQVECSRCNKRIQPGDEWHLDHDDEDRTRYRGPAHAGCNGDAGSRLGASRAAGVRGAAKRPAETHPGLLPVD